MAADSTQSGHRDAIGQNGPGSRTSIVLLAVWLGLIAWAAEYAILSIRRFVLAERAVWYIESMWLAALVYALAFTLLGGALALIARIGPRSRRTAVCLLVGLAALSVLLTFSSVHRLASLALAAGIGFQLGSMITARETRARRVIYRSLAPLAAATAVVVITLAAWQPVREWRAWSSLPDADASAPNVILIILDTVRSHELGLYGYGRGTTPEIDAFSRRGVTFDRAISTSSWTLPAHYSMLTGLYPHEMPDQMDGMVGPNLGSDGKPLSSVLRDRGYGTAGFVANMSYTVDETGLDRGFIRWEDHTVSAGQIGISTAPGRTILNNGRLRRILDWYDFPIRKPAARVNDAMLEWIDEHGDRPFFVLANYFDAHFPYLPPPEFKSRFVDREPTAGRRYHPHTVIWWDHTGHSEQELRAQRDMYDGAIAWMDSELGRLFDSLESRGILDNTLVIVTSDHGEAFGEHGRLGHGGDTYEELVHVPLIIAFEGRVPEDRRVADAVTLADLPATILDLIGIDDHEMPGQSMATAWDSIAPRVPDSPILASENTGSAKTGLHVDDWHYIRHPGGAEELYDRSVDPAELNDRVDDPAAAARLALMRSAMDSVMAITPDQRKRPPDAFARSKRR